MSPERHSFTYASTLDTASQEDSLDSDAEDQQSYPYNYDAAFDSLHAPAVEKKENSLPIRGVWTSEPAPQPAVAAPPARPSPERPEAFHAAASPNGSMPPVLYSEAGSGPCTLPSATHTPPAVSSPDTAAAKKAAVGAGTRTTIDTTATAGSPAATCGSRWVINPEHKEWPSRWDGFTSCALVYVAVVTPIEVGMMDMDFDGLFVVNLFIDLVFFTDMILQFFLMYPVQTRYGRRLEDRHDRIIRHYLTTWFPLDLMSVMPFHLIGLIVKSDSITKAKGVKVVRLFRLLKLTRVLKASRLFQKIEVNLSITYQRINLIKFFLMLAIVSHWQACIWALTLQLTNGENVPQWIDSITAREENIVHKTQDTTWKLYIASLYFSSYTMTSVGYGDVVPVNVLERTVCVFLLFWAGITWAYIIGQVSHIVGMMDAHEQAFRQTMDDLNFMMADRGIPQEMRRRLRSFFLYTKDVQRYTQHRRLLEKMSPALQGEVALTTNAVWISKVTFLKEFVSAIEKPKKRGGPGTGISSAPAFVVDIALALRTVTYAQEEQFGKPHVLYILNRGLTGRRSRVYRSGAVWGEDFVLKDSKLLDVVASLALTYVEVSCLERSSFIHIVESHKHVYYQLERRVRKFCVRLAAQRGILAEARRRRSLLQELEQKRGDRAAVRESSSFTRMRLTSSCTSYAGSCTSDLENRSGVSGGGRGNYDLRYAARPDERWHTFPHGEGVPSGELHSLREEVAALRLAQEKSLAILERLASAALQAPPGPVPVSPSPSHHGGLLLVQPAPTGATMQGMPTGSLD